MVQEGRTNVRRMDPILIRNLERYGLEVHEPSSAERASFAAATHTVADRVATKVGPGGRDLLRAIRAAH